PVPTFRDHAHSLLAEWILPAAAGGGGARRIGRLQIPEHDGAVLLLERRHVVAADHQVERVFPAGAAQALLRDQLEAVAGGAGVERFVASCTGGEILRAFVARREVLREWDRVEGKRNQS